MAINTSCKIRQDWVKHWVIDLNDNIQHRLFKLWDNPKWFILLILWWHPISSYLRGFWSSYINWKGSMHYCMWSLVMDLECKILDKEFMNILVVKVIKTMLKNILVITKLWIHFCSSSQLDQMTLLYIEKLNTLRLWISKAISQDILNMQTSLFKPTI